VLLRAVVLRVAPPVAGFALDARAFVPEELARVVDLRAAGFRVEALRVPVELRFVELATLAPPVPASSSPHLPDMTRWAASATASAMSEPSFDALDTIVLAAA